MTLFLRRLPVRALNSSIAPAYRPSYLPLRRAYAHSSYGGEGEKNDIEPNQRTRDLEHPGRAPPDVNQGSSSGSRSQSSPQGGGVYPKSTETSNKAHPTITDGRQSPNIDEQGNPRDDVPQDVKEHNQEVNERHDRPYNHIGDLGQVKKGF